MTDVRPSRFEIERIVRKHYIAHGRGMSRRELADAIGWKQTKNLPGVRAAIDERMVRYDDESGKLLVPYGVVER